jgi:hypothetical protein
MNKLHSLIDHLKDQEKGYMDLLNSFIKFQQLAGNYTDNATISNNANPSASEYGETETIENNSAGFGKYRRDVLDLSELNESLYQQQQQIQQQKQSMDALNNSSLQSGSRLSNSFRARNTENSSTSSMAGSFISDTLTLNGTGANPDKNTVLSMLKMNANLNEDTLAIIGKALLRNSQQRNEIDEDTAEQTENDQDTSTCEETDPKNNNLQNYSQNNSQSQLFEEDDEHDGDLNEENLTSEQRGDLLLTLSKDLNMLEQLREQKRLLRSIRLRKEELKALEGRRKALEALKKVAAGSNQNESENEEEEKEASESVFKPFKRAIESESVQTEAKSDQVEEGDEKLMSFFELLMEKKRQRTLKEEEQNEKQEKKTPQPQQPLLRKTFKHSNSNENNSLRDVDEKQSFLSLFKKSKSDNTESYAVPAVIEPASQIEKSKQTVRHYEEMIKKNSSTEKKINEDLNGLIRSIGQDHNSATESRQNFDNTGLNDRNKEELKEKLADLAESEKKLG